MYPRDKCAIHSWDLWGNLEFFPPLFVLIPFSARTHRDQMIFLVREPSMDHFLKEENVVGGVEDRKRRSGDDVSENRKAGLCIG
jgi:hypothetical protein